MKVSFSFDISGSSLAQKSLFWSSLASSLLVVKGIFIWRMVQDGFGWRCQHHLSQIALIAQVTQTIRNHLLLARKVLPFSCSWQRRARQIFRMNNVGFNAVSGNGCATVMQGNRDNIVTALADWPRGSCSFCEFLSRWMFSILSKSFINSSRVLLMAFTFSLCKKLMWSN